MSQQQQPQARDAKPAGYHIKQCLASISTGIPLSSTLAHSAMVEIMSGQATHGQIGAFLMAVRPTDVGPQVIAACANAMRSAAVSIPIDRSAHSIIDIVGTGGDGADTFNVSTAASIIVAAAGVSVLKHGNRSSSGKCGSADLVEAMGARLELLPEQAAQIFQSLGFCFLFAPSCHPSMRHAGPIRRELGIRTVFNVLGPLTNPVTAHYQLTGVYDRRLGRLVAETFVQMGLRSAMVVHSDDGMDEISPATCTHIWLVHADGNIAERDICPEDFGLPRHAVSDVGGASASDNVITMHKILQGESSPTLDYVLMSASAALFVAGKAHDFKHGVELAREAIRSGKAAALAEAYVNATHDCYTILTRIAAHRTTLVTSSKQNLSREQLLLQALRNPPPTRIDIVQRLLSAGPMALMAEIKRASPSLGDIAADIDPVSQALSYASAGAAAISVLTEPKWFKGTIDDLRNVRQALENVSNRPAVLLKDFVVDEYQLLEARVAGADTALLIVAITPLPMLIHLIGVARQLGMEPLVEVANASELSTALSAGAHLIGVNNRNLHTFHVDTHTTNHMATLLQQYQQQHPDKQPPVLVALSGIKTRADVLSYASAGARAVLVGETLMRAADPAIMIHQLLGTTLTPTPTPTISSTETSITTSTTQTSTSGVPFVKICGIRTIDDARAAMAAGADMIGLIFAESKRHVDVDIACEIVNMIQNYGITTKSNSTFTGTFNQTFMETSNPIIQSYRTQHQQITQTLHKARSRGRPLIVGVFMDQSIEHINEIATRVPLDFIQLHGSEGFAIASSLCRPVIRTVPIIPGTTTAHEILQCLEPGPALILLDTKVGTISGGTGHTFDWEIAVQVGKHIPFVVAGGLTPVNVCSCISRVTPWCVDVSSGVEIDSSIPPSKDHSKIYQFIRAVKHQP